MGRIKTSLIKRNTEEAFAKYGEKFTDDYAANKAVLNQVMDIASKKIRNAMAGYATRIKKRGDRR